MPSRRQPISKSCPASRAKGHSGSGRNWVRVAASWSICAHGVQAQIDACATRSLQTQNELFDAFASGVADADEMLRTTTVQVGTQGVRFGGLLVARTNSSCIPASRHLEPRNRPPFRAESANAKRFQLTAVRVTTGLQDCRYAVHLLWRFRRGQPFIQLPICSGAKGQSCSTLPKPLI